MADLMPFEDSLEEDDWGIIIGADGTLKGLFIPEGHDDDDVPEAVIEICQRYFGIDPTEGVTIH